MKNFGITIFIILIVGALGLRMVSFQVRETKSALVLTFGKDDKPITEPGWYFKWPYPIQEVKKYDSRMKVYAPEVEETTTAGGEPIIVNTYVVWRISNPLLYYNATNRVSNPEEELLRSQIRNIQNSVIGNHEFSEFVNSDETKIDFVAIENEMLDELRKSVEDAQYGMEIKTLGIKQLKVSEDVSKKVFDRMRADRNRKARDTISKGEAEAAQYYDEFNEDPDFAEFLLVMDALPKMLGDRTTILIDTDKQPFTYLWEIPDLKPKDPNEPNYINVTEAVEE